MKRFIIALAVSSVCGLYCPAQPVAKSESLSHHHFTRLMKHDSVEIIDVRTAEEFNEWHIPNAQNIDFKKYDFADQINKSDRNKIYLLYCRSGRRSANALNLMAAMGFKKVYHLKHGILKWKKAT